MTPATDAHAIDLSEADLIAIAHDLTDMPGVTAAWIDRADTDAIRALPETDTPWGVTEAIAAIESFGPFRVAVEHVGRTELVATVDREVR